MNKTNKIYILTSWIPPAALLLCYIWAGQYEGWGGWAAGAVVIIPLFLSFIMGIAGMLLIYKTIRAKLPLKHLAIAFLTASFPVLMFLFKALIHEIRVSF